MMVINRRFELATLAIYAACLAFALLKWHTPWRDELNSVLIAQSAHGFWDLLRASRADVHPVFWYALIKILPDHSLVTLRATLWVFSVAGAAVILFCSPFPRPVKAGLIFGFFFFYAIGMYFRPYVVILLVQSIWISFWNRRWTYLIPLSGLMAFALQVMMLAHLLALMVGMVLLIDYWRAEEKPVPLRRLMAAVAIVLIGSGLCFWQIGGGLSGISLALNTEAVTFFSVAKSIALHAQSMFGLITIPNFGIVGPFFVLIFVFSLRKTPVILVAFLIALCLLGYAVSIYEAHWQHLSFYFMLAATAAAMASTQPGALSKRDVTLLWAVLLGLNFVALIGALKRDALVERSNLANVGRYLHDNHLDELPIAGTEEPMMSPVLYFLPEGREMYVLGSDRMVRYFRPDAASLGVKIVDGKAVEVHESEILSEERVAKAAALGERVVLLTRLFPVLPDTATSHSHYADLIVVKDRLKRYGFRPKAVFPTSYMNEDYAVFVKDARLANAQ
jgi:hypothetical protein